MLAQRLWIQSPHWHVGAGIPARGAQPRRGDSSAGKDPRAPASLFLMGMRRRLGLLLAAVLGAAVVVLPAIAASETGQTITAENLGGGIYKRNAPLDARRGSRSSGRRRVTLSNPTEVKHGVEWVSAPAAPTCTSGVPVGNTEAASNTKWSGTCAFTTPGVYIFYCTVHHAAMTGRVTVAANGITTTTTTTTPTSTTTTTAATTPGESPASATGTPGSPLAGSAANAVKLPLKQHGKSVRGSVAVSPAGAGGRLEVDLLARSGRRWRARGIRHGARRQDGAPALQAGGCPFSVPLTPRAKRAAPRPPPGAQPEDRGQAGERLGRHAHAGRRPASLTPPAAVGARRPGWRVAGRAGQPLGGQHARLDLADHRREVARQLGGRAALDQRAHVRDASAAGGSCCRSAGRRHWAALAAEQAVGDPAVDAVELSGERRDVRARRRRRAPCS